MKQVPVLVERTGDKELILTEHTTILRYLATTSENIPDHWYPKDHKKRAIVNMYLDQHHSWLRQGINGMMKATLFQKMFGKEIDMKHVKELARIQKLSMKDIETRLTRH